VISFQPAITRLRPLSRAGRRSPSRSAHRRCPRRYWPHQRLGRTQRGGAEFGQSCRERLVRIAFANGSLPPALQPPEISDQLSDEDENDHAFTSIRPRECLGRAARLNGQFNPAPSSIPWSRRTCAIHSPWAILCAALTSPAWRVLDCAFTDSHGRGDLGLRPVVRAVEGGHCTIGVLISPGSWDVAVDARGFRVTTAGIRLPADRPRQASTDKDSASVCGTQSCSAVSHGKNHLGHHTGTKRTK
jgi:hypothetical protein